VKKVLPSYRLISGSDLTRIFALCASLSAVSAQTLRESYAESVEYAGRQFKVYNLKEIDPENIALEVDGQPLLASRATAGKATFKIYAQKPELLEREGELQGYGSWVATLPAKGEHDGAVFAVERIVSSPRIDPRKKIRFYSELVGNADGERSLFEALSSMSRSERVACSALGFLSPTSQANLKNRAYDWISTSCPQSLVELAQGLMVDGERSSGIALLRAATVFSGDGEVGDAARTSLGRSEALERALHSQDPAQLDSALKVASFDALLSPYFEKARPTVITEFSSRALREGHPVIALRGLSLLDFSSRNDAHHELLSKALGQLAFEDRDVLRDRGVSSLVWSYATRDEVVRRQYLAILEGWIHRSLDEDKAGEALTLFDLLKELRLDPSVENDFLRGEIAESFVDNGDERSAESVLSGLRTELPWIYRFRLLLKRDIYMLIMVALGGVVILRWAVMLVGEMRRRNAARRIAQEAERRAAEAAERERYHSQFAEESLRADGFMDVDEYAAGLKKFHLHPGASLADIKNAYRHVVKTLHPDINPRATKGDTDIFIDLTKTYERLLILHAEREQRAKPSK
jgi:hypothetical protein